MGSLTDSSTPIDCFYLGSQKRLLVRRKVEPAPLDRSWRGWSVCYRKLNKHLSACMLRSAQSLPCLRVWAPTQVSKFSRTIYSPNKSWTQLVNTTDCDHPQSMYSPLKLSIMHNGPLHNWGLAAIVWRFSHNDFSRPVTFGWDDRSFIQATRWNKTLFLFFTFWAFETREMQAHTFHRIFSFQVAWNVSTTGSLTNSTVPAYLGLCGWRIVVLVGAAVVVWQPLS